MIEVGDMEEINRRCISRKEYLNKYDSNVGYALYVQDNIRKDDYVRLNTGNIVKVIGIKANTVNKRAIYYGFYKQDWFDSAATENFSDNIIDLIEVKDVIKYRINNLDIALEETNHKYLMINQWAVDNSHKWGIASFRYNEDEDYWYLQTYGNFNPNVDWYDFGCLVQLGYKWIKDGCLYNNSELLGEE